MIKEQKSKSKKTEKKEETPFEKYCKENPEAVECRIYDV